MDYTRASKYLSRILRHDPAMVGLSLDEHGYLPMDALLAGMARAGKYPLTPEELGTLYKQMAGNYWETNSKVSS